MPRYPAEYSGKYYISIFVNQPTWDDLDKWVESFKDFTGHDPDEDPKAQIDVDIWNNIQQKFRVMRIFNTEEEARRASDNIERTLGGASYKVRQLRTRKKESNAS